LLFVVVSISMLSIFPRPILQRLCALLCMASEDSVQLA
jgi:hypothetical protein